MVEGRERQDGTSIRESVLRSNRTEEHQSPSPDLRSFLADPRKFTDMWSVGPDYHR